MTTQTGKFILQHLIIPYCFPVPFTFVLLASKVFHCLVIKHTIGMDTTCDLCKILITIYFCQNGFTKTYDITVIHFASQISAPLRQNEADIHCSQIIRLRDMEKFELVTICHHDKEYNKRKCPPEDDTECYQGNRDVDNCRDNSEEN